MKRKVLLVASVLVATACLVLSAVALSQASFTSRSTAHIAVSADRIQNWLHLYSQSTDPDGLTGYATRLPTTEPAATGMDETLAADLGVVGGRSITYNRVFTLATPAIFPQGSAVTISASVLPDSAGRQPITNIGFSAIGFGGSFTNPITLQAGQKRQLNLRVRARQRRTTYEPIIRLTLTYSGFSSAFYQYFVPVTVVRN